MVARLIAVLSLAIALVACEKKETAATEAPATEAAPTAAADTHVHSVACACSLGKKCNNMIEVDGEYVPLAGDLGLGEMAFCGKKGLKAKVDGEMKDGSFVATSFELVK